MQAPHPKYMLLFITALTTSHEKQASCSVIKAKESPVTVPRQSALLNGLLCLCCMSLTDFMSSVLGRRDLHSLSCSGYHPNLNICVTNGNNLTSFSLKGCKMSTFKVLGSCKHGIALVKRMQDLKFI